MGHPKNAGLAGCAVFTLLILVALLLTPFILMVAWNEVIAGVFGGPSLTFVQALLTWWIIGIFGSAFRSVTRG